MPTNSRREALGAYLRWALIVAALTGILVFIGLASGISPALVVGVSVVVFGAPFAVSLLRLRSFSRELRRLQDPAQRSDALPRIRARLARLRPAPNDDEARHNAYGSYVFAAAEALHGVGLTAEADALVAGLPDRHLSREVLAIRATSRAAYRLFLGDPAGARRFLDSIPNDDLPRELQLSARLIDARLMVTEERAREALTRLGEPDASWPAVAVLSAHMTRAHAHALLGDVDAARRELRALRASGGEAAVQRFMRLPGPATPLAATAFSDGADVPYRT